MFAQMAVFAVTGDQDLGAQDVVHRFQIGAVGMTRDMVETMAVVDHIHTLFGQRVLDPADGHLVAGNGLG